MRDSIEKEIIVRASKERVYAALTTPEQFVKWFALGVEGTFEAGEHPVLDFGEYGKFRILVVAADPVDYFAYRCVPGSMFCPQGFLGEVLEHPNTLVEFRLEAVPGGTKVHLRESGIASLPPEFIEQTLKGNEDGWTFMIGRLEAYLNEG
ncbi:MAG: SRPBCC domain-containing protein [Acidobacteria bacterium]|nr:SRPBCC domain-containing protein [Acidobacteriota bacterium]